MALTSVPPAVPGSEQKKLLDQTRDVLRLKHYSLRTERSYYESWPIQHVSVDRRAGNLFGTLWIRRGMGCLPPCKTTREASAIAKFLKDGAQILVSAHGLPDNGRYASWYPMHFNPQ